MDKNILLDSLHTYYGIQTNIDNLLSILESTQKISLRIIDWFVTNYSKKNNIYYNIYVTDTGKKSLHATNNAFHSQFNTYYSYKSQLKSFSKKRFDPFCRRDRIKYMYDENKSFETTVGQLNFFKWAIDNLVIDYIKQNMDAIEVDMNQSYNSIKKNKKESKNTRKQRQELSKSGSRGLSRNNIDVVLSFN
jgi:hypothetical protein